MRKLNGLFFVATALLLLAGCGGGGDAEAVEGQAFWQAILSHLLEIVVVVATPLILLLVRKLIQVMEDKTALNLSAEQEQLIDTWVGRGIAFAEEQAHKALKEGKAPLPGDEKKNAAVDLVAAGLKSTGIVDLGADALAKLVEAKLNMQRPPKVEAE